MRNEKQKIKAEKKREVDILYKLYGKLKWFNESKIHSPILSFFHFNKS